MAKTPSQLHLASSRRIHANRKLHVKPDRNLLHNIIYGIDNVTCRPFNVGLTVTNRFSVYPLDALHGSHLTILVYVQLEPGLDEPDRVGEGAGHEAGTGRGAHVHNWRVRRQ